MGLGRHAVPKKGHIYVEGHCDRNLPLGTRIFMNFRESCNLEGYLKGSEGCTKP